MNSFSLQTQLYNSQGSLNVLKCFTSKHIWIIYGALLARSPLIEKLRNALPVDSRIGTFGDITPDPIIDTTVQGVVQMQSLRPDIVMDSGDGSALGAVETIIWFSRQSGIDTETCVAIPTASGTGSEVASAYVISDPDKGIKCPLLSSAFYPDMAILDPTLVVNVPSAIIANTGIGVLTHTLEIYISTKANDFTDALVEKAA